MDVQDEIFTMHLKIEYIYITDPHFPRYFILSLFFLFTFIIAAVVEDIQLIELIKHKKKKIPFFFFDLFIDDFLLLFLWLLVSSMMIFYDI